MAKRRERKFRINRNIMEFKVSFRRTRLQVLTELIET